MATPPDSAALDTAVREALRDQIGPDGETVVAWIVLGATRRFDGGGTVIVEVSDGGMPAWTAKGIMDEGLEYIRRVGDDEHRASHDDGPRGQ